jgi:hypothetical protein
VKTLHRFKFIIVISYVFLVFCAFSFVHPVLCSTEAEAREAIEAAESEVLSGYNAVFEAEKAGANVSELLSVLNEAGWLLSKAKLAYNVTDFDSAVAYANECSSRLDGFLEQAENLKLDAEHAGYWDFMVNFVGSAVGAVCVVVGGFAIWTFLKKREQGGVGA